MYLCTFLWSVHSHYVVPEKLLKELHLGNAEVEVQTAGHVHLQRVATHHHLLHRGREDSRDIREEEVGGERAITLRKTSGLFATLSPSLYEHSLLLSAILAHLFLFLLFPLSSPGSHPQPVIFNHSLEATSNRISFTNTPQLNHTQATKQQPKVNTHNVIIDTFMQMIVIIR